jgi:predicted RNase H-like HicB family nuclease
MNNLNYTLPVSIFKEGDSFVAYTPALDLSTMGETFDKVQENFKEAVEIFFEEVMERGTLDEVLTGYGWTKVGTQFEPPVQISSEPIKVSIPLNN